ncbi:MAG: phosphomethylpyrimidine synthase ThiC [Pseudomonadota bacterium]
MTLLENAKAGIITREMEECAKFEGLSAEYIRQGIADGTICIPINPLHTNALPYAIGRKLKTKVNANIGTSPMKIDLIEELAKLEVTIKAGAHFVMDLSTGGNLTEIRQEMIKRSTIPVGTVPIYELMVKYKNETNVGIDEFLEILENHGQQGVDFLTIHNAVTEACIPMVEKRLGGVVSRGGSYLIKWIKENKKESFLYTHFDQILEVCKKYDMALSIGDGLRPGCLADATDEAQIHELKTQGELQKRAFDFGVQVFIEGPGHIPLNQVQKNMELEREICNDAPFYVLGPIVTDVAPGYDHITSAIGGAVAAMSGAAFLCYVTRAEHLKLPSLNDVREGVITCRIAAHAADIAKGIKGARDWDDHVSRLRANLDWKNELEAVIDPQLAKSMRDGDCINDEEVCSMCGEFCSVKTIRDMKNK